MGICRRKASITGNVKSFIVKGQAHPNSRVAQGGMQGKELGLWGTGNIAVLLAKGGKHRQGLPCAGKGRIQSKLVVLILGHQHFLLRKTRSFQQAHQEDYGQEVFHTGRGLAFTAFNDEIVFDVGVLTGKQIVVIAVGQVLALLVGSSPVIIVVFFSIHQFALLIKDT